MRFMMLMYPIPKAESSPQPGDESIVAAMGAFERAQEERMRAEIAEKR